MAETRKAFENIQESTDHIVNQIHDISAITEQMSASSEEVAASVQEVSHIAQVTTESLHGVSAAAQQAVGIHG